MARKLKKQFTNGIRSTLGGQLSQRLMTGANAKIYGNLLMSAFFLCMFMTG